MQASLVDTSLVNSLLSESLLILGFTEDLIFSKAFFKSAKCLSDVVSIWADKFSLGTLILLIKPSRLRIINIFDCEAN